MSDIGTQSASIKTAAVETKSLSTDLHVTGRIQPEISKEVDISTRFSGRVLRVIADLGTVVKKGDVLATVDSHDITDLQAELIEAASKLAIASSHRERERQIYEELLQRPKGLIAAKTDFERARVQLKLTEAEFKRQQELHVEKIASAKDFMSAQANLEKMKFDFKEAESALQREDRLFKNQGMLKRDYQLANAEMAREKRHVDTLRQRLAFVGMQDHLIDQVEKTGVIVSEIPLVTPQGGVITDQHVASGEMVEPNNKLFTVTDLSIVVVAADLPEIDLRYAKMNAPVAVTVASYPDETFNGTIRFISEHVNSNTRTVSIRALLKNPDHKLKSHMFAEIDLAGQSQLVLAVPKSAVHDRGGQKVVYVAVDKGFEEREIKVGRVYNDDAEVLSGLKEGEHVATQGSLLLKTAMSFGK